jgi:hypothetical protein
MEDFAMSARKASSSEKWRKSGVPCSMKAQTPWPKYHRQSLGNLPCI